MEGWIALHRQLIDSATWKLSTPEQKTILITLLLMVGHQKNKWEWSGQKFTTDPGQTVTSINSIIKACGKGITTQNVRSALKRFEKLQFLTNKSTKSGRLITIINWSTYQIKPKELNIESNKGVTKGQQTGNKGVTSNNNVTMEQRNKTTISVPLKDGTFFIPEEEYLQILKTTYKSIDIQVEFNKMISWCISNPDKQKTKKGSKKFINGWMNRANEKITPVSSTDISTESWF